MQTNLLPLDISIYKLKSFQIKIEHWSIIVALKFFKENVLVNFGVMVVFVKVAFEITKRALSILFLPWFTCFLVFRNSLSLIKSVKPIIVEYIKVIYETNNEWYKPFGNIQKLANLSAISPVFSVCIIANEPFERRCSDVEAAAE